MKEKKKRVWSPVHSTFFTYVGSADQTEPNTPNNKTLDGENKMKETNDGPFGLKRIVTDGGTTFFRNADGIFDEAGKKVMMSMAELRRFEVNERQKEKNLESKAASSDDAGSADQAESNTSTTES